MITMLPPALLRFLQIATLGVLAALLWTAADGRAALDRLRDADAMLLALAGVVLIGQTVMSAQRWRITARQMGLAIAPMEALREYYLAQVVNQSLPGGVAGDANRAYRQRQAAGLMVSAKAVLFERLAGQLGLLAVLLGGLAVSAAFPEALSWPAWLRTPMLVVLGVCATGAILARMLPRVSQFLRSFVDAVWAPPVRAVQIALSLGTALCNVAAFAICARALGVAMPMVAVAALVPLILFAMVLPISIAGWGVREGAAALLFPVMGATAAEGLAVSIAFGLVFLLTTLPGLVAPLLPRRKAETPFRRHEKETTI